MAPFGLAYPDTESTRNRTVFGDYQTPEGLADRVCELLTRRTPAAFASILEPTCGRGAFLRASEATFQGCEVLLGYEINERYAAEASATTNRSEIAVADVFTHDWATTLNGCAEPILCIGNLPWVTNSALGAINGRNLPTKTSHDLTGLEAVTGKSNFDVSEWILSLLVESLSGRHAVLAMLCKTAVARKVLRRGWEQGFEVERSDIYNIDARTWFGVDVNACLLVCVLKPGGSSRQCDVFGSLTSTAPESTFGVVNDQLVANLSSYATQSHLDGTSLLKWRSGIKHDCCRVMELTSAGDNDMYLNGFGEEHRLEQHFLYPMLKSSDLVHGNNPSRYMLVPQSHTGADTNRIASDAPLTWRYLQSYSGLLNNRRSAVYRNRPPFSVFGVGGYTFSPWKVAISGFHKRFEFRIVGPVNDSPVVLDDTCYFLPCHTEADAMTLLRFLTAPETETFFESLVFWDAKRPITAGLLSRCDLGAVAQRYGAALPEWTDP